MATKDQSHEFPVEFLPTPPVEVRAAVNDERRRYAHIMGEAALSIQNLNRENKDLTEAANTDTLTGLGNRRKLDEKLPELIEYARSNKVPVGIAFADVNGLHRTNERSGYPAGDRVKTDAASAFSEILRSGDEAFLVGGDEYVAVLYGYTPMPDQSQAELDAQTSSRLSKRFMDNVRKSGLPEDLAVGLDIGIATLEAEDTPETLLVRAQERMKAAKQARYDTLRDAGLVFEDRRNLTQPADNTKIKAR